MTEYVGEDWDEVLPTHPNGELVHWMARKPVAVGVPALSATAVGAFAAGAAVTLGVLALLHLMEPARAPQAVARWRSKLPF